MSLERLEVTPFSTVVRSIITGKRSGYLTISKENSRRTLYWAYGELILIACSNLQESFWSFLVHKSIISAERRDLLAATDPLDVVPSAQTLGLEPDVRRSLEREWLRALTLPLFSLDSGTTAFAEAEPLAPERRILAASTPALVVEGVRSISNGLVLRHSLGDLKTVIEPATGVETQLARLPLSESEHAIAQSLKAPRSIDSILKEAGDSGAAGKIVVALMTLGIWTPSRHQRSEPAMVPLTDPNVDRDMAILAALGSSDPRSLKALALSRRIDSSDFYTLIDVPRGAPTSVIVERCEVLKREYDPSTYPPIVRDAVERIQQTLDRILKTLGTAGYRQQYDKLLHQGNVEGKSVDQEQARIDVARQNLRKARDLSIMGDYYGAIVLLKQSVHFDPGNSEAWHLLGSCQERNPKWRRDAATSYQKSLAADPNNIEAMISLGDLYRSEGLATRAQTFYEDVLKIDPEHELAKRRIKQLKGK